LIKVFTGLLIGITMLFGAKNINIDALWGAKGGGSTTTGKIKQTKSSLSEVGQKQKKLNKQLSKIAASIKEAEKENRELDKELKKLNIYKVSNEKKYNEASTKIDKFKNKIGELDTTIKSQREQFVNLLINRVSLIMAMQKMDKKDTRTIIREEIYKKYKELNVKNIEKLDSLIKKNLLKKRETQNYQKKIEASISEIIKKRKAYMAKKKQKEKLLKKLHADEIAYRKNIKDLMKRESLIRSTLAKLNIIRKDEIERERAAEKARQEEINRRAEARNRAVANGEDYIAPKSFSDNRSVKQVGSSYHVDKIYRYRGIKTISPLNHARVVKSFGTYVDPLYKMKIFNESITLKSAKEGAKVRNVLNGKVVFAGENSMLGKMIVIAHGGKMHTVYAGLSRISPVISKGSRVKKGAIIGRVKRKLIFEATKNSKYINPLRLIRL